MMLILISQTLNILPKAQLLEHWRGVTGDDGITQVDVRAVRIAVMMILKSSVGNFKIHCKDYDYANHGRSRFDYYHTALRGAKTLRVGGELRMIVNIILIWISGAC